MTLLYVHSLSLSLSHCVSLTLFLLCINYRSTQSIPIPPSTTLLRRLSFITLLCSFVPSTDRSSPSLTHTHSFPAHTNGTSLLGRCHLGSQLIWHLNAGWNCKRSAVMEGKQQQKDEAKLDGVVRCRDGFTEEK
ncbi:uncharacterized protein SOCG_05818 [Schizosaccharomyces octosporus yFS286]|uniref:Uncharacterized protein n=1 Tax=Schizosaccharomyces octosporus (strain yFS286) TaxID=483514 RepID=S9Q0T7_SCHOY|nr:uncharacterized protein SOCG_05818 [Schizosaccharomyces octosporus yFS286]EPX73328.1 hypothetical protein SOCG_05818 [Schizosaccharomyces octosporus yFS286]